MDALYLSRQPPRTMTNLDPILAALGLPPQLAAPLHRYVALFLKWNASINLSAARSEGAVVEHVIDCLHLVPHVRAALHDPASLDDPARGAPRMLDVGAGGGLPAVVVAITVPELQVTALEPVHKKHAFLRTAARELGLANLEPLALRLEDHARRDYTAAVSRATLDLRDWLLLGLRHVQPGGTVFGFEAMTRDDLPSGTCRHPYTHLDKTRAIVALQRVIVPEPPAGNPTSIPPTSEFP
jgi:16S rRNA (guanine527-N7)-methyltransferase